MTWGNGTSKKNVKRARRTSPTVKPVELHYA
jgi:hypothetical protein